ncbi:hypothetical protein L4D09_20940 [Photobacterium makurazakiensis]|uniref:hypothetical protein n=1 Tax=Photobacterium makurazakiensis TaxID=2910234 RepID=UPI003D0F3DE2
MQNKILSLLVFVLIASSPFATANNDERIRELEYQIKLLTHRVNSLEGQLNQKQHNRDNNDRMYQCQLNIFGERYKGRSSSRGKAITKVVNECSNAHDDMFCRPEAVKCTNY